MQYSLFTKPKLFSGGELSRGKRKGARVLSSKRPLHLSLKARSPILYRNRFFIQKEIQRLGKKFAIKTYGVAVEWNHLHLVVKFSKRENYKAFIRSLTGILAKKIGKGLWQSIPFSRVLSWGKDFLYCLQYLEQNRQEAAGLIPTGSRTDWYQRLRHKHSH